MKFAYADPPYFGCAFKLYGEKAVPYDTLATHHNLLLRLDAENEAWAYSLQSTALHDILPLAPSHARIAAWGKSFCSFKPGVNPAYAWEPVIWSSNRKRGRDAPTVRDFFECPIALKRGLKGAKPEAFCFWLFDLLGARDGDDFTDLFVGSGAVSAAWEKWRAMTREGNGLLFADTGRSLPGRTPVGDEGSTGGAAGVLKTPASGTEDDSRPTNTRED